MRNRHILRPWKKSIQPDWRSEDAILNFRKECEEGAKRFGKIAKETEVLPVDIEGIQAEWLIPSQGQRDGAILFFHGGGYVSGSCADHGIHVSKFVIGANLPKAQPAQAGPAAAKRLY